MFGVNNASALRNAIVQVIPCDKVHTKCRQAFINRKNIVTNKEFNGVKTPKRVLRKETTYDNKKYCFLCATELLKEKNHLQGWYSMQKSCEQRGDEWAIDVKGRMEYLTNIYVLMIAHIIRNVALILGLEKMFRKNLNRTLEGLKRKRTSGERCSEGSLS